MTLPKPAIIFVVALPIVALLALAVALIDGYRQLGQEFDPQLATYTGSDSCIDCHQDRHDSWFQTFHRTMTQKASATSVQGEFDGRNLDFQGVRVQPTEHNGRYFFEYFDLDTGQEMNRIEVHRTVGSNRYQQYLTRIDEDGTYVRLHYLWHNGDQRWVHMNAAFLGSDGRSYDKHIAIWNQNCIFCHNTGVEPGMLNDAELRQRAMAGEPVNLATDTRFRSTVAELGISCETCHGPGSEHVARGQEFWTRQAMRMSAGRDNSIVNPVRDHDGSGSQICGQCHAQRIPANPSWIMDWMKTGPSYRPGDDLYAHVTPVRQDLRAPIKGQEDMFRNRFWADGTARLTAYEYQGMTQSKAHQETDLSCMDCHTMHAGDPRGQITERQRGNGPCLRCHQEYQSSDTLVEHTRHAPEGPGSLCYDCHMPEIVYGVMDIHRSHRIESPDAIRDAASGRPNACLNCHLEQTPDWAMNELAEHWNGETRTEIVRLDGADSDLSEAATMLFGDPVQKAIIAFRAGQPDNAMNDTDHGRGQAWIIPYLLTAMGDNYPSTRRFSHHSLISILERWPEPAEVQSLTGIISTFDFIASPAERAGILGQARRAWVELPKQGWPAPPSASGIRADYTLPEALSAELMQLGARQDKQIDIGE